MNFYALLPLLSLFTSITLGVYVFFLDPKNSLNRLYAIYVASMALYELGAFLTFIAPSPADALLANKFSILAADFSSALIIHFCFVFIRKDSITNLWYSLIYLPPVILTFFEIQKNAAYIAAQPTYWGYEFVAGPMYVVYSIFAFSYVLFAVFLCLKNRPKMSVKEKKQISLMVIAILIPLGGSVVTDTIPSIFFGVKSVPLATLYTAIFSAMIAYGMRKYGPIKLSESVAAETIIETMADFVVVVSEDMRVMDINSSFSAFLDMKKSDLVGKPISTIPISFKTLLSQVAEQKAVRNYEKELVSLTADKPITLSINATAIYSGSEVTGYVLVMHDMSHTKELIVNLEKTKKEIEAKQLKLEEDAAQLKKMNDLMINRELKMAEMKKDMERLQAKA